MGLDGGLVNVREGDGVMEILEWNTGDFCDRSRAWLSGL